MNRPFSRFWQDVRENVFFRQIICPAVSFVSFLQEKKTYPFLFFLERKEAKENQVRGAASLFFCRFRQRGIQNGRFVCEPSVFFRFGQDVRESIFSQINQLSRSVFCFFSSRKENVPLQEKKSFPLLFFEKEKKKPCLGFLLLTILDRFSACVVRYGCSAWLSLQRRAEERRCGRA